MFDKTLDALIGTGNRLAEDFEASEDKLKAAADTIIDTAVKQIDSGKVEKSRLMQIVENEIRPISDQVKGFRERVKSIDPRRLSLMNQAQIFRAIHGAGGKLFLDDFLKLDYPGINETLNTLLIAGRVVLDAEKGMTFIRHTTKE